MVAPLLAAGLVAGGLGALQTGLGIGKAAKAAKERKKAQSFFEQNQYAIPEAAQEALSVAERQASSGRLPYEDITRARMGEATARGVSAARQVGTSASDIMAQMASLYGQQQRQETQLGEYAAQRYDINQRYLGEALNRMAGYETEKWKYNVLYPYQQMMERAGQLQGQGAQMISSGVGQMGSAAATYLSGKAIQSGVKGQEQSLLGNANQWGNPSEVGLTQIYQ